MLLIFHDIITHQPISCCQQKIDGMGGLCLKCILDEFDASYE